MQTPSHYRFGDVVIDAAERRVEIGGRPAKLGARAFDLLLALVERRDRVVSKNELLDIVWPKLVVEENNLQVQVAALRKLLGPHAIATIPGRGYRFAQPLAEDVPAASPPDAAPAPAPSSLRNGNLPAVTPTLFGRDADLAEVARLVDAHRLVSIVGAGGIGKTTVALAVAASLRERFPDGAWWIELAALTDGSLVAATIARTVGVGLAPDRPAAEALATALADARLLLALDNCEHLLDAIAPVVEALVNQAPGVRILVTSQETLKAAAEHAYRLGTLAVPGPDASFADAERCGAVALFVERAAAADPRFRLTADTLPAVADVCARLDGIPLAIELAAARVPLLGVEGLRTRLDERFRLLTAGARTVLRRHQTLRAALEWSHGLLGSRSRWSSAAWARARAASRWSSRSSWPPTPRSTSGRCSTRSVSWSTSRSSSPKARALPAIGCSRRRARSPSSASRPRARCMRSCAGMRRWSSRCCNAWALAACPSTARTTRCFAVGDRQRARGARMGGGPGRRPRARRDARRGVELRLAEQREPGGRVAARARVRARRHGSDAGGAGRALLADRGHARRVLDRPGLLRGRGARGRPLPRAGRSRAAVRGADRARGDRRDGGVTSRRPSPRWPRPRASKTPNGRPSGRRDSRSHSGSWPSHAERYAEARQHAQRQADLSREAGIALSEQLARGNVATSDVWGGEPARAIPVLRSVIAELDRLGAGGSAGHMVFNLAEALRQTGEIDEALAQARRAYALLRREGDQNILLGVLPRLAADRGRHEAAVRFVGYAKRTHVRMGIAAEGFTAWAEEGVPETLTEDARMRLRDEGAGLTEDQAFALVLADGN